ncbi:hypothetical protein ACUH9Y_02950 [Dermabacteraceae bacterium P13115]
MNGPWYPPKRLRATLLASGALVLLPATAAYAAEEAPAGESLSHDPHASLEVSVAAPETSVTALESTDLESTDAQLETSVTGSAAKGETTGVTRVVVGTGTHVSHKGAEREGGEEQTGSAFFKPVKLELPGVSISFKGSHGEVAPAEKQPSADSSATPAPAATADAAEGNSAEANSAGSDSVGTSGESKGQEATEPVEGAEGTKPAEDAESTGKSTVGAQGTQEDTQKNSEKSGEETTPENAEPAQTSPDSLPASGRETSAAPAAATPAAGEKTDAKRPKREADKPQRTGGKRKKSDTPLAETPKPDTPAVTTPAHNDEVRTDEAKAAAEPTPRTDSANTSVSVKEGGAGQASSAEEAEATPAPTQEETSQETAEAAAPESGSAVSQDRSAPAASAEKRAEKSNSLHILASNGELSLPSSRGTSVPVSAPAQGRHARGAASIAPDSFSAAAAVGTGDTAQSDNGALAAPAPEAGSVDSAVAAPGAPQNPEAPQNAETTQVHDAATTGAEAARTEQAAQNEQATPDQEQNSLAIAGSGNSDNSGTSAGEQVLNVAGAASSTDSYVSLQGLQAALGVALVAAFAVAGAVTAGTLRSRGAITATAAAAAGGAAAVAAKRTPTHRRSR